MKYCHASISVGNDLWLQNGTLDTRDAFIIEVELEDVGNSNTANTIDDDIEFVGEFGL